MTSFEDCGIIRATKENTYSTAFENVARKSEAQIWVRWVVLAIVEDDEAHLGQTSKPRLC